MTRISVSTPFFPGEALGSGRGRRRRPERPDRNRKLPEGPALCNLAPKSRSGGLLSPPPWRSAQISSNSWRGPELPVHHPPKPVRLLQGPRITLLLVRLLLPGQRSTWVWLFYRLCKKKAEEEEVPSVVTRLLRRVCGASGPAPLAVASPFQPPSDCRTVWRLTNVRLKVEVVPPPPSCHVEKGGVRPRVTVT